MLTADIWNSGFSLEAIACARPSTQTLIEPADVTLPLPLIYAFATVPTIAVAMLELNAPSAMVNPTPALGCMVTACALAAYVLETSIEDALMFAPLKLAMYASNVPLA